MSTLFQIITLPLQYIWSAFVSIFVDSSSGVTLAGLILSGVAMAVIIGIITHISISGGRTKGFLDRHD